MIRVVLDTNVVVSALNRTGASPGTNGVMLTLQLLQEIGANRFLPRRSRANATLGVQPIRLVVTVGGVASPPVNFRVTQ